MKSIAKLIFVCLFLTVMASCNSVHLPSSYDKSRWTAQEVDFYFDVDSRFYGESSRNTKGILETKEKSEVITIGMRHPGYFYACNMPTTKVVKNEVSGRYETKYEYGDYIFEGSMHDINEKGFKLSVDEEYQYIFGDEPIKEITFVREEMPKDEESESLDISKGE